MEARKNEGEREMGRGKERLAEIMLHLSSLKWYHHPSQSFFMALCPLALNAAVPSVCLGSYASPPLA